MNGALVNTNKGIGVRLANDAVKKSVINGCRIAENEGVGLEIWDHTRKRDTTNIVSSCLFTGNKQNSETE
jgi:hypothetical protein